MEEAGRVRRGYFVAGLGATQFALPGALDLLRSFRPGAPDADGQERELLALAAADPANPYGSTLPWPTRHHERRIWTSRRSTADHFCNGDSAGRSTADLRFG